MTPEEAILATTLLNFSLLQTKDHIMAFRPTLTVTVKCIHKEKFHDSFNIFI